MRDARDRSDPDGNHRPPRAKVICLVSENAKWSSRENDEERRSDKLSRRK